jgi:hypothetical protein
VTSDKLFEIVFDLLFVFNETYILVSYISYIRALIGSGIVVFSRVTFIRYVQLKDLESQK